MDKQVHVYIYTNYMHNPWNATLRSSSIQPANGHFKSVYPTVSTTERLPSHACMQPLKHIQACTCTCTFTCIIHVHVHVHQRGAYITALRTGGGTAREKHPARTISLLKPATTLTRMRMQVKHLCVFNIISEAVNCAMSERMCIHVHLHALYMYMYYMYYKTKEV